MNATSGDFRRRARSAIADQRLQGALDGATAHFRTGRQRVLAELPDSEALRDHLKAVRAATMAQLANHLEIFEQHATAAGAQVHWAAGGADACQIIADIARRHEVQLVAKSKSMATEEIGLNDALQAAGIQVVETDLGEWIIQLAGEPPSHIIAPAVHKTRQQVAELFSRETGRTLPADDIDALTAEARSLLRRKFLEAGMGISGANIGVAESGSIVLVTNEGNGRMVSSLPPVHVVIMGIEKIAPTWDDTAVWLSLLARNATGQPLSVYTSVLTGPARGKDPDGPEELHIVLLDNGRSRLMGTAFEEVLQCIRCGACLNVCPVYQEAGGHAYGSPYSGPIGAVVSPLLFGLERYDALPWASSLCGACLDVCPVRIDLPRMLLELRRQQVAQGIMPPLQRLLERMAAHVLSDPRRLRRVTRFLRLLQKPWARQGQLQIPTALSPSQERRLPALAPVPFRERWMEIEAEEEQEG